MLDFPGVEGIDGHMQVMSDDRLSSHMIKLLIMYCGREGWDLWAVRRG